MAKKNHIQRVHIWDDPESRINFLETTLADQEWEAVIYEPVETGNGRLPALKKELTEKGYKTQLGKDSNGIPTLTITHFNHETSLLKVFSEMGLVAGIRQTLETSGERLGNVITRMRDTVNYFMSSEARRFSTIYAFGDLALGTLTDLYEKFTKKKKADTDFTSTLKNFEGKYLKKPDQYYNAAYNFAFAQSLIMMLGMKEAKELIANEMQQGLTAAQSKGLDLSDFDAWAEEIKDRRSKPVKLFQDTAIYTGPAAQIIGQIILAISGIMRLRNTKKFLKENPNLANQMHEDVDFEALQKQAKLGAVGDITTGSLSVLGWSLLGFAREQKIENKENWNENFFKRLGQEIKSSPNTLASLCVTLASVIGIKAGDMKHSVHNAMKKQQKWEWSREELAKNSTNTPGENLDELASFSLEKPEGGINKQVFGNALYLVGDATVALTKNRNYESGQIANIDAMANTAMALLDNMPVAFSKPQRNQFITKVSAYMAKRLESLHDPKKPRPERFTNMSKDERISVYTNDIRNEILSKLPEFTEKFDRIIERAANVVIQFEDEKQDSVKAALAETLAISSNISAEKADIINAINESMASKEAIITTNLAKVPKAVMASDIQTNLSALVQAIPGEAIAQEAMNLFSAIEPFMLRTNTQSANKFLQTMSRELSDQHPRVNNDVASHSPGMSHL